MTNTPPPFLRLLLGPTASGKESVALACARSYGTDIISVDSMKVYRGLDIGTAKPSPAIRREITHHCLDLADPLVSFTVADFITAAEAAIGRVAAAGKKPLLSGGTALYYKNLLEGMFAGPPADAGLREELNRRAQAEGPAALHAELARVDPAAAEKIHPHDLRRIIRALEVAHHTGRPISSLQTQWERGAQATGPRDFRYPCALVGLAWPREELYRRIEARVDAMLAAGLLEEARGVFHERRRLGHGPLQAVGYKEFFPHFAGQSTLAEAVTRLKQNSRQLAKSQLTWFRKFPCAWVEMTAARAPADAAAEVMAIWDEAEGASLETV